MREIIILGNRIPHRFFLTSGTGESNICINAGSYHMALKNAGIDMCNIMRYSSILPEQAEEVNRPKNIAHGCVMETIEAKADACKGQRATAGIGYGWLYGKDKKRHGGIVAEYDGDLPIISAKESLEASLKEIAAGFRGRKLGDINFRLETIVPKKKYGTSIVSLCFVDYIWPIERANSSKFY